MYVNGRWLMGIVNRCFVEITAVPNLNPKPQSKIAVDVFLSARLKNILHLCKVNSTVKWGAKNCAQR